ncbi:hypothetical protein RUM44_001763 [Polyplax serrata]|uniref:Uncharacterized protein n=1 Tax=Polyplax serrata TaxID=468196 RepID=A0ABR1AKZ1_POLSC
MKCFVSGILMVCLLGATASAMPSEASQDTARQSAQGSLVEHMLGDCLKKDSLSCFKYKLFSYLDNALGSKDAFSLGEGLKVVKTENTDGSPRSYDEKPADVETMLVNRFERFMDSHTFKFDVKGSDIINGFSNAANSLGLLSDDDVEGRGKKSKYFLVIRTRG